MNKIIRPWATESNDDEWPALIEALYAQSDEGAEDTVKRVSPRKPLSNAEDIALVDDILDALMDPLQVKIARPVIRHALKEIAKTTLLNDRRTTPWASSE